uniref:Uncharacterized protein n=1 Tax=viral metagenome TaxID=1070528 RepID=A0A6M3K8E8_9ZZZZ
MFQWLYGTTLSGLSFPMVTASGTYAQNYLPTSLSTVLSRDGQAWQSLTYGTSSIPGGGIYTIPQITSSEMSCHTWFIKVTANSGCLEQGIAGYNLSGPVLNSNISGFAHEGTVSGLFTGINTVYNVSGKVTLEPTTFASSQIAVVTEVRNAQSAPTGTTAAEIWASANRTLTSTVGIDLSSINAIRDIDTGDSATLTSSTLGHDLRLLRYEAWENWTIDKRYDPDRLYLKTDGTNYSSYFELRGTVASTITKTRGG